MKPTTAALRAVARRLPSAVTKKKAPKLPLPTEHQEQVALFQRIALHPRTKNLAIFAIPNGGHRHKAVAAKMKAEGVKAGVPDIFVAEACYKIDAKDDAKSALVWHGLFIEMKRAGNKPTDEQEAWLSRLYDRGYKTVVCYSCTAAWFTLCEYLGIPL